jgi:hypothetical protein
MTFLYAVTTFQSAQQHKKTFQLERCAFKGRNQQEVHLKLTLLKVGEQTGGMAMNG